MSLDIRLDKLQVFDWYDGLVRGVAVDASIYYLLILVGWRIRQGRKLYAVLALRDNPNTTRLLKSLVDVESKVATDWSEINKAYDECIREFEGPIGMITGEISQGQTFAMKEISDNAALEGLAQYDLQDAIDSDSAERWFDRYSSAGG